MKKTGSNTPDSKRDIIHMPQDPTKAFLINTIISKKEYGEIQTFREQLAFIYMDPLNKDKSITYDDLHDMFKIGKTTVNYHIEKYKMDIFRKNSKLEPRKNGRPFTLTEQDLCLVKEWISTQRSAPKFSSLQNFVQKTFGKKLDYNTYLTILDKLGYKIVKAKPLEENRYEVTEETINIFYEEIETFTREHNIPCAFAYNIDEEGYDEYSLAKNELIIVNKDDSDAQSFYPVPREGSHTTFLGAIDAYGNHIKPLIVTKRVSLELEILRYNISNDRIMIATTDKGYITQETFNQWIEQCFAPHVRNMRAKYNYDGPGLVILDGASQHFSKEFFQMMEKLNIYVVFIPPHSSNQVQPLDLGTFHVHKERIRHTDLDNMDDSHFVSIICQLFFGWECTVTISNVKGAWEAMGAVFEVGGPTCTYIRFHKQYALKLLGSVKTVEERNKIKLERLNYGNNILVNKKRLAVDDFNKLGTGEESPKAKKTFYHLTKRSDNIEDFYKKRGETVSVASKVLRCLINSPVAAPYPVHENHHKWKFKKN